MFPWIVSFRNGRMQRWAKGAVVVGIVVALALTWTTPPAHGADMVGVSPTGSINVTAVSDYGFQPDTFQNVPTNATITVTFSDDDVLPHSFLIVSREGYQIPNNYTTSQLNQFVATYPPLYYTALSGGGQMSVHTFHSPDTPGWYEFVCNVTGHFQFGMYGFVAFGENLPTNLILPSHGSSGPRPLSALDLGAVGGSVVVALLLIYFVWRRRTAARRPYPSQPKGTKPRDRPGD